MIRPLFAHCPRPTAAQGQPWRYLLLWSLLLCSALPACQQEKRHQRHTLIEWAMKHVLGIDGKVHVDKRGVRIRGKNGSEVRLDKNGVRIRDKHGQEESLQMRTGAHMPMPKGLPAWLPIYPGSQPLYHMHTGTGGRRSRQLTLQTRASVQAVTAFYRRHMPQNKREGDLDIAVDRNLHTFTFRPDGAPKGTTVLVAVQAGADGCHVQLQWHTNAAAPRQKADNTQAPT
ncbi:MAG: hypothetical protein ACPGUV_14315 [Polyangiales bacterium]